MAAWEDIDSALDERGVTHTNKHQSCQPCGCDTGAMHRCKMHTEEAEEKAERLRFRLAAIGRSTIHDNTLNPLGIGGAPTRATTLPESAADRKKYPVASGVLDYFPDALAAIAHLSWKGNEQHNPGKPLHWDRSKSGDEADTLIRHFLQRGTLDTDGIAHSVKVAWRSLALLQKEIEAENAK